MSEANQLSFVKKARKFFPEVREEVKRVTWPSRKETSLTTLFVFVFALIAAIYFMIVDTIVHKAINALMHLFT
jgi:preprotein translocase subunit SecE